MPMNTRSIRIVLIILGLAIVAGAAYVLIRQKAGDAPMLSSDASILNKATLNQLPKKAASSANLDHIADGMTPPTNSWISGLALQKTSLPVYPMPLSFQAAETGFTIGLPTVVSAATTITGGHTPDVVASVERATTFQLTRFDKTSATLTYKKQNTDIANLTMAQGSPYVFYRAVTDNDVTIASATGVNDGGDFYRITKGEKQYVVSVHDGATIKAEGATLRVHVPKNSLLALYALPANTADTLKQFSGNELTSVDVHNEVRDTRSLTKLDYKTVNNQPTVIAMLPYESVDGGDQLNGMYRSIYGDMKTYQGTSITTSVPLIAASGQLDLKNLTEEEKAKIVDDLKKDSQDVTIKPQDTYFAGKQLARLANLLSVAKQLNQDEISSRLQEALTTELTKRLGKEYLYYDTELKGVAAQTKAFGSEDFNDHHFHYGYFIYAASILGKYDQSFVDSYKDDVNLLVADIASYENYSEFPIMRTYDPYSGHSWAAGLAPFQDGNNQESSSEAMNAWNAVTLWSKIIGNKTLEKNGQWMLSNETATAAKAWRNVDTSAPYLKNYTSPVSPLNFGGKRTYSTFFNDESNAKLGVQLIPMSPVMQVFSSDGDGISKKLSQQTKPNDYNVVLGDYLLMYLALHDKAAAAKALNDQKDEFIDDGNSRAYLRAWIYAQ